jgi:uncharacterized protein (DUF427 family)
MGANHRSCQKWKIRLLASFGRVFPQFFKSRSNVSRSFFDRTPATSSPVQYNPAKGVDFSQLERTDHATYCPFKGDCSYYSIPAGGKKSVNAVWSYQEPFAAVEQIKGHVAFYPDRVDEIAEQLPV